MPLILPARTLDSGYEISNSLRIGSGRKLSRTFTEVTAERKKHTMSCWIKLCILDGEIHMIISIAGSNNAYIRVNDDHKIRFRFFDNGQDKSFIATNRLFRDVSAWQHIMLVYDSAQSTASNRVKIYVNGEQQTSFSNETYPDQNEESIIGNNAAHSIEGYSSGGEFYVADWYYIGNQALSPSDFGETNDNGVWVPKKYEGSFGSTNDTFLEFKQTGTGTDASGIGADTSGQNNHMASTNLAATDVTTDTPTNNWCTLNSLSNLEGSALSEGNTKAVTPAGSQNGLVPATMGVQNGKWYWEVKVPTTNYVAVGIIADDKLDKAYLTDSNSSTRIVKGDDGTKHSSNSSGGNYMAAYEGSILQVALNLDDGEITFGAGGSWANGSGSTNQTFSNSTPAYTDLNSSSDFTNKFILPVVSDENQGTSDTFEMNFGNAPFSISSGNADANGYGNFEYAVPSGFYSLCTKNLAEYG